MRRLAKSIARNGPHEKKPSFAASTVPKRTGTAAAVKEKGRASQNHSDAADLELAWLNGCSLSLGVASLFGCWQKQKPITANQ